MTKLCSSLQNITNRDMKARMLSIVLKKRGAVQRAFYKWVANSKGKSGVGKVGIKSQQPSHHSLASSIGPNSSIIIHGGNLNQHSLAGASRVRSKTALNMASLPQKALN